MLSHFENARPHCTFQLSRWELVVTNAVLPSCLGKQPLSQSHGSEPLDLIYLLTLSRMGAIPNHNH